MPEIPDVVVHWALAGIIPAGGMLFMFLLKRTFKDFEDKLATLFGKMESAISQAQDHDTRLAVLTERVDKLEKKRR